MFADPSARWNLDAASQSAPAFSPAAKVKGSSDKAVEPGQTPSPSCAPHEGRYIGVRDRSGVPLFLGPYGGVFAFVPGSGADRRYLQAFAMRELNLTDSRAELLAKEVESQQEVRAAA